MIFLCLAIVCSAALPLLFRAFHDWRVNVFWAIPANYLTCVVVGLVFTGVSSAIVEVASQSWFIFAILQGTILAVNFFLLAYTAQRAGVAVAALASRLSVAIPAILAFPLYGDSLTFLKVLGLTGSLLSLYLCTAQGDGTRPKNLWQRYLPILVFVTFGCYFSLLKFAQTHYLDHASYHLYVMSAFFFAFALSLVAALGKTLRASANLRTFDVAGGVALGLFNYGAVYFLITVLGMKEWESSQVFPIYSVGVVAISSLLAVLLFEERLSRLKTIGLVVGLGAVVVLNQ